MQEPVKIDLTMFNLVAHVTMDIIKMVIWINVKDAILFYVNFVIGTLLIVLSVLII